MYKATLSSANLVPRLSLSLWEGGKMRDPGNEVDPQPEY